MYFTKLFSNFDMCNVMHNLQKPSPAFENETNVSKTAAIEMFCFLIVAVGEAIVRGNAFRNRVPQGRNL